MAQASGLIALVALIACLPVAAGAVMPCGAPGAPPSPDLAHCLRLEEGVQANLDGRLDEADAIWAELVAHDPRDPTPRLWRVETAFWRVILNEGELRNDETILEDTERVIELAKKRLKTHPRDAVALYQRGAAHVHRARLHGIRGRYLAAGREGERGRKDLERALALRPDDHDAKYILGLYDYYVSVAPSFLKWVSWLPFVPKGDREAGLAHLHEVQDGGSRHATDAAFILMNIHTYHGPMKLSEALDAGRRLHAEHPGNALFHSELVEVLVKIGLYDEAIETALALERSKPEVREARVRPQLARILRAQAVLLDGRADEAWSILEPMDAGTSALPSWGGAWLHLVRGQIHDATGRRERAVEEYERVLALEGVAYNRRAALIARAGMEQPFEPSAYREQPMISAAP